MRETPQRRAERLARLAAELHLTPKERAFSDAYAADPEQNQTAAARAAGYRDPERMGCLLTRRDKVRTYVEALRTEAQQAANARTVGAIMEAAEIEERLARISRVNIPEALRKARESGDPLRGLEEIGELVESVTVTKRGIEVKVARRHALGLLTRIRGMLRDRVEVTGAGGGPIVIEEDFGERKDGA